MKRVAGELGVVLRGARRDRALAIVGRRIQQHVQVVFGIDGEPFTDRRLLVRVPGLEIGADGIAPPADLVPGVGRHVVDVARARDRPSEKLGARFSAARHSRRLCCVHVEMAGAGMVDISRQDALEHLVQSLDVRIVDVARAAPGLEDEERVRIQRRDLEVVWKPRHDLLHGVAVGAILFDPLRGVELLDVANRHRLDHRAFLRRRAVPQRSAFCAAAYACGDSSSRIGAFRYEPHAHASPQ